MTTPIPLVAGDRIGITAPARKISLRELKPSLRVFRTWGLEVQMGKSLFGEDHQFSGSDAERAADIQQMLDDPSIRAIFCARGGYGSVRIIDRLDFSSFCSNPKWIVGYSDVTVLHAHLLQNYGIPSLHAMMPLSVVQGKKMETRQHALQALKEVLFGKLPDCNFALHPLNRYGEASGTLCGGNLSILYSLLGSVSDLNTDGKILFLEDLDEYLYHIDRMMMALKRAGKFEKLSGLIIGGMSQMRDNKIPFGKTAEEIIAECVAPYSFPVSFGFPAGHIDDNRPLIIGGKVSLKVTSGGSSLHFLSGQKP